MTKIVIAWELGTNYGHLARNLPLAQYLRAAGHDVWFAVSDLRMAQALLGPHNFPFVACPKLLRPAQRARAPVNYSDILTEQGYGEVETLRALINAWVHLWRALQPQVIVADYAPSALLSARILSIPSVNIGAPFSVPPLVDPLPSIRPWDPISNAELMAVDTGALAAINDVLKCHHRPPLARIADLFSRCVPLLTTFADLDCYAPRVATYLGPIAAKAAHPRVHWAPGTDRKRVFANLRTATPGIEPLFIALKRLPIELICVVADAPDSMIERLHVEGITARNTSVDLVPLLPECDLAINCGGAGSIAQAFVHGVPILLMPHVIEQRLNALQAGKLGFAIDLDTQRTVDRCNWALNELLFKPEYRERAGQFRDKYSAFNEERAIEEGVRAILEAV